MSLEITHLKGAYRIKVKANEFEIISGKDDFNSEYTGLLPSELLEISLGLCQGLELAAYLNRKYGIDEKGFTINVRTQDKEKFTEFLIDINLHSDFNEKQMRRIRDVVDQCGISDIIKRMHKVTITLNSS